MRRAPNNSAPNRRPGNRSRTAKVPGMSQRSRIPSQSEGLFEDLGVGSINWSGVPMMGDEAPAQPDPQLSQTSLEIGQAVRNTILNASNIDSAAGAAYFNDPQAINQSLVGISFKTDSHSKLLNSTRSGSSGEGMTKEHLNGWHRTAQQAKQEADLLYTSGTLLKALEKYQQATETYHKLADACSLIAEYKHLEAMYRNIENTVMAHMNALKQQIVDLNSNQLLALINAGQYTIPGISNLRELGRGACGIVLMGHHKKFDIPVALKIQINPDDKSDLFQNTSVTVAEARLLARIKSNQMLRVFDIKEDQYGNNVMVMEYIEGGKDLAQHREGMERRGERLAFGEMLQDAIDMATGIRDMHEQGVIHRDIKPDNVMVDEKCCKIGDPGLAISIDNCNGNEISAGTPVYMSWDAFYAGNGEPITPKVDVYALALTLYSYITGKNPTEALEHCYKKPMNTMMVIANTMYSEYHDNNNAGPVIQQTDPNFKAFRAEYKHYKVKGETNRKDAMARFVKLLEQASSQDVDTRPTMDEFLKKLKEIQYLFSEKGAQEMKLKKRAESERLKASEASRQVNRANSFRQRAVRNSRNANSLLTTGLAIGLPLLGLSGVVAMSYKASRDAETARAAKETERAKKEQAAKERLERMTNFIASTTTKLESKQSELATIAKQDLETALSHNWDEFNASIDEVIKSINDMQASKGITAAEKIAVRALKKKADSIKNQIVSLELFEDTLDKAKDLQVNSIDDVELTMVEGFPVEIDKRFGKLYEKVYLQHASLDAEAQGTLKKIKDLVISKVLLEMGLKVYQIDRVIELFKKRDKKIMDTASDLAKEVSLHINKNDNGIFIPIKRKFFRYEVSTITIPYFQNRDIPFSKIQENVDYITRLINKKNNH